MMRRSKRARYRSAAQADESLFMAIEELDLPATIKIELNTAPEGSPVFVMCLMAEKFLHI
jgi:hypothetical protein